MSFGVRFNCEPFFVSMKVVMEDVLVYRPTYLNLVPSVCTPYSLRR
jgi:hypothetical protein